MNNNRKHLKMLNSRKFKKMNKRKIYLFMMKSNSKIARIVYHMIGGTAIRNKPISFSKILLWKLQTTNNPNGLAAVRKQMILHLMNLFLKILKIYKSTNQKFFLKIYPWKFLTTNKLYKMRYFKYKLKLMIRKQINLRLMKNFKSILKLIITIKCQFILGL